MKRENLSKAIHLIRKLQKLKNELSAVESMCFQDEIARVQPEVVLKINDGSMDTFIVLDNKDYTLSYLKRKLSKSLKEQIETVSKLVEDL